MITELRKKRGIFKSKITNFSKYLQEWTQAIGVRALKLRLCKIEELYSQFDEIQSSIELLDESENLNTERENFDKSYYDVVERAYSYIESVESQTASASPMNISHVQQQSFEQVKLPVLEIPKFSGKYCDYQAFADLFNAIITNNNSLSSVQKLYYLKNALSASALNTIKDLPLTDENFLVAWRLLEERFCNKKAAISELIDNILSQQVLKEESKVGLHNLIDITSRNYQALKTQLTPERMLDTILIHITKAKCDNKSLRQWQKISKGTETFSEFLQFLQDRCRILDSMVTSTKRDKSKVNLMTKATSSYNNQICSYCKSKHYLYQCIKFKALDINKKYDHIKQSKACINCLSKGHFSSQCKASMCKICKRKHNTLLHRPPQVNHGSVHQDNNQSSNNSVNSAKTVDETKNALTHTLNTQQSKTVLLSTAKVSILNSNGKWITCRALLDNAAESNFITQSLAETLNLEFKRTDIPVISINNTVTQVKQQIQVKIMSKFDNKFKTNLNCLVVPTIAGNIPNSEIDTSYFEIPAYITLADPEYYEPTEVQMLLNANVFWDVIQDKTFHLGVDLPKLRETRLGWLITGTAMTKEGNSRDRYHCQLNTISKLERQIEKFWELENVENEVKVNHNNNCETLFTETINRDETGRYIVTLPLKLSHKPLGDSYQIAEKRMKSLEKKFEKSPEFQSQYNDFMEQYIQLGHMSEVSQENNTVPEQEVYYLPHFGVLRETSTSTPLRTVFNASQKTTSGVSLNDILQVGPVVQDSLFNILLRFRMYNYVLSSDIKMMYRQISVAPHQRCLQRICWRTNRQNLMKIFQLNTVTYGVCSSPFLAQRTLQQLYEDESHNYPLARKSQNSWYMDDCLVGTDQKTEAIIMRQEITDLLAKGGFRVCKWVTNDIDILNSINPEDRAIKSDKQFNNDDQNRLLGLLWKNKSDIFTFSVESSKPAYTKRAILSSIASLWDPLGMLSPLIVRAKLIMQKIWNKRFGWDEVVDTEIQNEWDEYVTQIQYVNEIQIPRPVKLRKEIAHCKLHAFADASMKAYGSVIYLVTQYSDNTTSSRLVASKGKVVSLNKKYTIPKLETQAAYLSTKLGSSVAKAMTIEAQSICYHSDSQILLAWVKNPSRIEESFVINRISKILELSQASQWHYVSTKDNPADIITRSIDPLKLAKSNLWWEGPELLVQEKFPMEKIKEKNQINDVVCFQSKQAKDNNNFFYNLWGKFSNFHKLVHVVAMCRRFASNCQKEKEDRKTDCISLDEIQGAKEVILKQVQKESFSEEVKLLGEGKTISNHSKLKQLNPFLDDQGILRVGGRIQQADLSEEQKHPIILPPHHKVTRLMITQEHLKNLHAGPQNLLHIIRQTYWVLNGRRTIRSQLAKCHICLRVKPQLATQLMGNLPRDRITTHRAFSIVGTDYCGPISIKQTNRRNAAVLKSYIVIFICMTFKAIHLDLAEDLSTRAFLNVFQRFISRRGKPNIIYSDNAKNYVGANKQLQQLNTFLSDPKTKDALIRDAASEGVKWKFNPARAAHEGGLWESAVKSVKFHLKRVIGNNILQKEQLYTLLTKVEACLNSRPLSPITEDPEDINALTPAHFLIGSNLKSVASVIDPGIPTNRLTMWQQSQQMLHHFWKRWTKEYLASLQMRHKWFFEQANVQKDQLVWIQDKNVPPLVWKLGRIENIYPDQQGVIRHVEVRTPTGLITRSIRNIAPLPLPVD